jgi:hypothetical protein
MFDPCARHLPGETSIGLQDGDVADDFTDTSHTLTTAGQDSLLLPARNASRDNRFPVEYTDLKFTGMQLALREQKVQEATAECRVRQKPTGFCTHDKRRLSSLLPVTQSAQKTVSRLSSPCSAYLASARQ